MYVCVSMNAVVSGDGEIKFCCIYFLRNDLMFVTETEQRHGRELRVGPARYHRRDSGV